MNVASVGPLLLSDSFITIMDVCQLNLHFAIELIFSLLYKCRRLCCAQGVNWRVYTSMKFNSGDLNLGTMIHKALEFYDFHMKISYIGFPFSSNNISPIDSLKECHSVWKHLGLFMSHYMLSIIYAKHSCLKSNLDISLSLCISENEIWLCGVPT